MVPYLKPVLRRFPLDKCNPMDEVWGLACLHTAVDFMAEHGKRTKPLAIAHEKPTPVPQTMCQKRRQRRIQQKKKAKKQKIGT